MSEEVVEMKIVETEEQSESTETTEELTVEEQHKKAQEEREKQREELTAKAEELAKTIESSRIELAEKKYDLVFKSATNPGDFDESVYDDPKKYLSDVHTFLSEDAEFSGVEFIGLMGVHAAIGSLIENYQEGGKIEIDFTTLEALYGLIFKTNGKGINDAMDREYLLRPINNTYALYQEAIQELEAINQEYTQIINVLNDPRF